MYFGRCHHEFFPHVKSVSVCKTVSAHVKLDVLIYLEDTLVD